MRCPIRPHAAVLLLSSLLLAACANHPEVVRPNIPNQLMECRPEPTMTPGGDDTALANYIVDLALAGRDCRDRLGLIKKYLIRVGTH